MVNGVNRKILEVKSRVAEVEVQVLGLRMLRIRLGLKCRVT